MATGLLVPSINTWEEVRKVVRYTRGDKQAERYSVFSSDFVRRLLHEKEEEQQQQQQELVFEIGQQQQEVCQKVELAVSDLVPEEEYSEIFGIASKSGFSIINPRQSPYYPRALWLTISHSDQILNFQPQFDGQVVLIVVDPTVPWDAYRDILFHAVKKGYIVLNCGYWREHDLMETYDSKFEAEFFEKKQRLLIETDKREEAEDDLRALQYQLRVSGMHDWKATIESLDEEIADLQSVLQSCKPFVRCFQYPAALYQLGANQIQEVRDVIAKCCVEDALFLKSKLKWHGASPPESLGLEKKETRNCTEMNKKREKAERWIWSLVGITTTLGFPFVFCACLRHVARGSKIFGKCLEAKRSKKEIKLKMLKTSIRTG